jgi:hypothetical protein
MSEVPKRKPNVHYKSVRTSYIGVSEDSLGEFIIREIDHDTGTSAVVACYRNDPIAGVRTASDVSAHLTLRDAKGEEIGTGLSKACWLNNPSDTVELEPGITQHVVLLVLDNKGGGLSIPWKRWIGPGSRIDSGFIEPARVVEMIDVEILDSNGEPLLPLSSFSVSTHSGHLAAELNRPS